MLRNYIHETTFIGHIFSVIFKGIQSLMVSSESHNLRRPTSGLSPRHTFARLQRKLVAKLSAFCYILQFHAVRIKIWELLSFDECRDNLIGVRHEYLHNIEET